MAKYSEREKFLEEQRKVLLDLGNDFTRVRAKDDLIALFSSRIKSLYYFTHIIITLIDRQDDSVRPFLFDHEAADRRSGNRLPYYLSGNGYKRIA